MGFEISLGLAPSASLGNADKLRFAQRDKPQARQRQLQLVNHAEVDGFGFATAKRVQYAKADPHATFLSWELTPASTLADRVIKLADEPLGRHSPGKTIKDLLQVLCTQLPLTVAQLRDASGRKYPTRGFGDFPEHGVDQKTLRGTLLPEANLATVEVFTVMPRLLHQGLVYQLYDHNTDTTYLGVPKEVSSALALVCPCDKTGDALKVKANTHNATEVGFDDALRAFFHSPSIQAVLGTGGDAELADYVCQLGAAAEREHRLSRADLPDSVNSHPVYSAEGVTDDLVAIDDYLGLAGVQDEVPKDFYQAFTVLKGKALDAHVVSKRDFAHMTA